MFKVRTTPVEVGTKPYAWDIPKDKIYQCTWYSFYRALEVGYSAPCYWDRATKTGSYTNAKEWLDNFREPWEVKDRDYTPVAGDIAVFDGNYGHVQFLETDVMYSEYSNGNPNSFRNGNFVKKSNLLGFLHFPLSSVDPVERNNNVDQIETTDATLRIRTKPSLKAEIVGYVQIGYYNVLQTKEADGYTWYEIEKNRWCANVTTNFLPKSGDIDIVKRIKEFAKDMQNKVDSLNNENQKYKETLNEIHDLSKL